MGKKILIVDDAAFMRMMLRDILTKANYEVVGEAANGQEAVDKYKELHPDFVTMDITMPVDVYKRQGFAKYSDEIKDGSCIFCIQSFSKAR